MAWQLKQIPKIEWEQDDSGVYTIIHWTDNGVRIDIMTTKYDPVISFIGPAEDVRKHACRYLGRTWSISTEHASYIGREIGRAEILEIDYIQD